MARFAKPLLSQAALRLWKDTLATRDAVQRSVRLCDPLLLIVEDCTTNWKASGSGRDWTVSLEYPKYEFREIQLTLRLGREDPWSAAAELTREITAKIGAAGFEGINKPEVEDAPKYRNRRVTYKMWHGETMARVSLCVSLYVHSDSPHCKVLEEKKVETKEVRTYKFHCVGDPLPLTAGDTTLARTVAV